ncbi:protein FAM241B [Aplysia californica]|uniref:Protein FAM241B n=1 Tax=Aplysia californica TaxID=6500 RepID=A0ABM0K203_APLCA|nr:protein FAM241B [Aplysia californica]XP_005106867.1 protein FAM241B [Aplysia californica]XP_005106868.1 protein FAM241B [Aplysia californica]XP_005106869.1 protein FAM241B [Aplysia californica]XP_005106870.1 protein FAM241B [Aplysia californica]
MVRILANGDIVPDDDPRAQQNRSRPQARAPPTQQRGSVRHEDPAAAQGGQPVNLFHSLNERLRAMGIPPWTLGNIVIEPLVTVGFIAALLLFGIHGLIFGVVLFAVSRWSTHGAPEAVTRIFGGGAGDSDRSSSGNNRRPQGGSGGGGGYRLGRD